MIITYNDGFQLAINDGKATIFECLRATDAQFAIFFLKHLAHETDRPVKTFKIQCIFDMQCLQWDTPKVWNYHSLPAHKAELWEFTALTS